MYINFHVFFFYGILVTEYILCYVILLFQITDMFKIAHVIFWPVLILTETRVNHYILTVTYPTTRTIVIFDSCDNVGRANEGTAKVHSLLHMYICITLVCVSVINRLHIVLINVWIRVEINYIMESIERTT